MTNLEMVERKAMHASTIYLGRILNKCAKSVYNEIRIGESRSYTLTQIRTQKLTHIQEWRERIQKIYCQLEKLI